MRILAPIVLAILCAGCATPAHPASTSWSSPPPAGTSTTDACPAHSTCDGHDSNSWTPSSSASPTSNTNTCGSNSTCCPPSYFVWTEPLRGSEQAALNWSQVPAGSEKDELGADLQRGMETSYSAQVGQERWDALRAFVLDAWHAQVGAGAPEPSGFRVETQPHDAHLSFAWQVC